ncbi:hypothetical protein Aduo_005880 [Ancylostoma duodenale]
MIFLCLIVSKSCLKTFVEIHRDIHWGMVNAIRPNTSDFPQHRGDIESPSELDENKINIVLTLSIDGVKLKKLIRFYTSF